MKNSYIPYAFQNITGADIAAVTTALQGPSITRGAYVDKFEKAIADYCGARYAVAFNSGSTALLAAYNAVQVKKGDRLISTPNTFVSTVGSGVLQGATPVFVDIDRQTGNLNLEQVGYSLEKPSSRNRSIIVPVHFAGIAVNIQHLDGLIKNPDVVVIEDACHAIGSSYDDGQKVGSCAYSHMTVFSFHPAKTITTGEGGMVTTNDINLYKRLRLFRNNGIEREPQYLVQAPLPGHYSIEELSSNYNFTDFQAALGLSQFSRLEAFVQERRELVTAYRKRLKGKPHIKLLTDEYDSQTAFHLFVVQIDFAACRTNRTEVMQKLHKFGIGSQLHYIPVYRLEYFQKQCGDICNFFPEMEIYYQQALTLPLYCGLGVNDIDHIVKTLCGILKIHTPTS